MKENKKNNILQIVKRDVSLLILVALLSVIVSFINISFINFEKNLTDAVLAKNRDLFMKIFWTVMIIVLIKIFLEYIKAYFYGKFSEKTLLNIRTEIARKLNFASYDYIEKNTTGDFISRISNDLSLIQSFIGGSLNDIIYQPIVFLIGLFLALSISWKLTLFCFTVIPICIIGSVLISKPVEKFTRAQQEAFGDVNAISQDVISGINILKAFNLEKELYSKFLNELKKAFKEGLKSAKFEVLIEPLKVVLQISPFIFLFLYGGRLVIRDEITFGGIIAFINLLNVFLAPVSVLPNVINSYRKAKAAAGRIEEILNQPDELRGVVKDEDKNCVFAVEFENVSFSYDGERDVLKDLNFKIKRGEKVAIVGGSGSGKSTIVKLILGLYKPQKGIIKIFGIDINDWDTFSLREKISVANQDIYLFPESVKENIQYGKYSAKDEEIISCAKKAFAYDFVMEDLGGIDEEIGERGVKISGGERQRIAIARFLLRDNAELYILDEATSALDTKLEADIQKVFEEELNGKTVIIVAHRFSSIKIADRIIVLENGEIVEEGTHKELFEKRGTYYHLYLQQSNSNGILSGEGN